MNDILTIVLVLRSGGDFNFSDVELLSFHLHKQITKPFRILCLSDIVKTPTTLSKVLFIPFEYNWPTWWSKMNLFSPNMEQYRPFLYMDLDTAVIGNVDSLFPPTQVEEFTTLENCYYPNRPGSGLMWIPANNDKVQTIWDEWIKAPENHVNSSMRLYGDQNFIEDTVKVETYFGKEKIDTFKPKPTQGWRLEFPKHLSIVYFHGKPRPKLAAKTVAWVKEYVEAKNNEIVEETLILKQHYFIKKAYVINIGDRTDRLADFRNQKFPFFVHRFPAKRLANGNEGCKVSHKMILDKQEPLPVLVCEDDCKLVQSWDVVDAAIKELPEDWDLLFIGANLNQPLKRFSKHLFHLKNAWTTHALIYGSERVVKFIRENMPFGNNEPIDVFYSKKVLTQFNCFVVSPIVAIQKASFSDIVKGDRDYEQLMLDNFTKYTR